MFSQTSSDIAYDTNTGILSAECLNSDNQRRRTFICLNDCLYWHSYGGELKIRPCNGPAIGGMEHRTLVNYNVDHMKLEVTFGETKIGVHLKVEKRSSN